MMELPPFHGRRLIYIGTVQAQDTFEEVNRAGGMTIQVGTDGPTAAKLRIDNIACVHTALTVLVDLHRDHGLDH
jgi:hypothetical protein